MTARRGGKARHSKLISEGRNKIIHISETGGGIVGHRCSQCLTVAPAALLWEFCVFQGTHLPKVPVVDVEFLQKNGHVLPAVAQV